MRCATLTYTTTMKPHSAVRTSTRARASWPASMASPVPARLSTPTMPPTPTDLACMRSSARLARTSCQYSMNIHASPSQASASPARATPACRCAPASHSSQPPACRNRGHCRRGTGSGSTRSQLGPAVNRKPAKNSGMKPNTMAAACVSVGDTA